MADEPKKPRLTAISGGGQSKDVLIKIGGNSPRREMKPVRQDDFEAAVIKIKAHSVGERGVVARHLILGVEEYEAFRILYSGHQGEKIFGLEVIRSHAAKRFEVGY